MELRGCVNFGGEVNPAAAVTAAALQTGQEDGVAIKACWVQQGGRPIGLLRKDLST